MKAMKETTSTTWSKLLEIPCDTSGDSSILPAMRDYTDFFDGMDDEELLAMLHSEWCSICSDGVVVWADGKF